MTKSVLITGASTGIGKAAALLFMNKGWNVAATMRSPEKEKDWTGGEHVAAIRLDVNDIDSIREGIGEATRRFGAIDVIVNNAGYGLVGPFEASSREQVERQFATNVFGLMNVTREILPHFRERRGGAIVNVASVGGRMTFPLYSVYNATKWAVEGFSESLQFELRPFGIRVRIVEPGPIKTDFYDRSLDLIQKPGLTAYDTFVSRAMPALMGAGEKGATPESVAKVIWRAATDRSWRLRYPANAAALLSLRRLLPDRAFNAIVRKVVLG